MTKNNNSHIIFIKIYISNINNKNDILLDTNILIYFFKDDTDFYKVSVSILENEKFNLFITTTKILIISAKFRF